MKMIQDIIVAPIVTESSMEAMQHKKYTFKVMKTANKVEIAKAVEAMFPGTKVAAVNTMNCDGKLKRMGRYQGYTASYKKAKEKNGVTVTRDRLSRILIDCFQLRL